MADLKTLMLFLALLCVGCAARSDALQHDAAVMRQCQPFPINNTFLDNDGKVVTVWYCAEQRP